MSTISPREGDFFYQAAEPVCIGSKHSRTSGILTPVVFLFMKDKTQSGIRLERKLVQKIAEPEYDVPSLGTFFVVRDIVRLNGWRIHGWYLNVRAVALCWACRFV